MMMATRKRSISVRVVARATMPTYTSMNPGLMIFPVASIRVVFGGVEEELDVMAICVIVLPSIKTEAFFKTLILSVCSSKASTVPPS
jgi:hypothetical protein